MISATPFSSDSNPNAASGIFSLFGKTIQKKVKDSRYIGKGPLYMRRKIPLHGTCTAHAESDPYLSYGSSSHQVASSTVTFLTQGSVTGSLVLHRSMIGSSGYLHDFRLALE